MNSRQMWRDSRRLLRLPGSRFSTLCTSSAPVVSSDLAISSMAVREGLFLPLSKRLMYLGWYPLSKASASWLMPRSCRIVIRTRAKALFSRAPRSVRLPGVIIGSLNRGPSQYIMPQTILSFSRLASPGTNTAALLARGLGSTLSNRLVAESCKKELLWP